MSGRPSRSLIFPNANPKPRLEEEQEFKEFAAQPGAADRIFSRIAPQVRAALRHALRAFCRLCASCALLVGRCSTSGSRDAMRCDAKSGPALL